ncbi:hypothetical protein [Piscinibacterium candidicorallinum]|jgi:hypothetical protein|uniref:6-phosphogluconate dehydrogenase n=1 Tax=Piscinibacterium candidicorallinum TaxID=1793872 RepID=A0ABV7H5J5_9BURK
MSANPPVGQEKRGSGFLKGFIIFLLVLVLLGAAYFAVVLNWNYSDGERAGWVQKFSRKGWVCKTWEGELALVTMPGAVPEKFNFTVWDDAVAQDINRLMGKRVNLHYEQKVGLPGSCFGETRYYVTKVTAVDEFNLAPGVVVPQLPVPAVPAPAQPAAPQPAPQAVPQPSQAPTAPATQPPATR